MAGLSSQSVTGKKCDVTLLKMGLNEFSFHTQIGGCWMRFFFLHAADLNSDILDQVTWSRLCLPATANVVAHPCRHSPLKAPRSVEAQSLMSWVSAPHRHKDALPERGLRSVLPELPGTGRSVCRTTWPVCPQVPVINRRLTTWKWEDMSSQNNYGPFHC